MRIFTILCLTDGTLQVFEEIKPVTKNEKKRDKKVSQKIEAKKQIGGILHRKSKKNVRKGQNSCKKRHSKKAFGPTSKTNKKTRQNIFHLDKKKRWRKMRTVRIKSKSSKRTLDKKRKKISKV